MAYGQNTPSCDPLREKRENHILQLTLSGQGHFYF